MISVAVIGGSGFYDFLTESKGESMETPFGQVEVFLGYIGDQQVVFIPRHGTKHSIPPHKINYKANVYALHRIGVERIFSSTAVGSCRLGFKPGDFMLLSSFLDMFRGSPTTFFDGSTTIDGKDGTKLSGVVHTDVSEPYCPQLREAILKQSEALNLTIHPGGVYGMMTGPRFETPAEIEALQRLGGDVVGMTNAPEVILARELGLCYATIAVITNYAAGMQERITHEEVTETFDKCIGGLKTLLKRTIEGLPSQKRCPC